MTPTNCTGARWLADAEKNVPDPPSTLSAFPNGVSTESSATDPTTRTVMIGCWLLVVGYWLSVLAFGELLLANRQWPIPPSHPLRRRDSQEIESVAEHEL